LTLELLLLAKLFLPVLEPLPEVLLLEYLIDPLASEAGLKSENDAELSLSDGDTGMDIDS